MPSLDLTRALRICHMGHEVTQLGHLGQTVWTAAAASPVISITSGSGYAGSVYSSTVAGQWTADGVAIAGATGTSWTMTVALEGKAIRCGASNVIRMWTPAALTAGQVCWLDPKWSQTVAAGKIVEWPDRFGVHDFAQTTAGNQLTVAEINGKPVAYSDGASACYLQSDSNLSVAWLAAVAQFGVGTETAITATYNYYPNVVGCSSGGQMQIKKGTKEWNGVTFSKNGGSISSVALPMPLSVICGASRFSGALLHQIGGGSSTNVSWNGYVAEVLLLSSVPTDDEIDLIEGCMAHRNGLSASLPAAHPYKTTAPRIA